MTESSQKRRPTIAEIAAEAGVSIPTVSKVINQRPDVAKATRQRVEQIILERGFVSSRAASSLRRGRSEQVDIVIQDFNTYYAFEIVRGAEEAMLGTNVRLSLTVIHNNPHHEQKWFQKLADGSTEGAILILVDNYSPYIRELFRLNIPFVVVDRLGELNLDIPSVGSTNWSGGKLATEYLLSLGHRRVAAIPGYPHYSSTKERVSGYRAALEEYGIPFNPDYVRYGNFHPLSAYHEALKLFDLPEPPTAIFAGNDDQALGVYKAARERDIYIPRDLSVIGFDDMYYSQHVVPALTTIRQPLLEMGRTAGSMILRLIKKLPIDSIRVELATTLIERESCAPPRDI